jgi:ABC-2 type transport system permease protein
MEKVILTLKRVCIFNKRLLKKPSFLAILLIVLILVLLLGAAAKEESGMLTVALAMEDPTDPTANAIVADLLDDGGLIRFVNGDSPKAAQNLVEQGQADAAWIFPENLAEKIRAFAAFPNERNGFVAVIQREESVFLGLSLEKLNCALYPYLSLALCENYVYSNILTVSDLSQAQLKQYYDAVDAEGEDLFAFVYANGGNPADTENANYLLSPVRGLLAVMIVLGGLAAAMFYTQDEATGVFDRLPRGKRFLFSVGYPAVAVLDVALAVFAALGLAGLLSSVWYEAAVLLLYVLAAAGFCLGLRLLLPNGRVLAAVTPALVVAMTVLCPIFINSPELPVLQYLLPPHYYLKAVYNPSFLGYMAIYAGVIYGIDWLLYRVRSR